MPTLTRAESVWTLHLGDDENVFSPQWLSEANCALNEVAESGEPAVLVTTGSGKFYSNGLDLNWLGENPAQFDKYLADVQSLLERVLTLPVPTVAAMNGHAFGAGAMLGLAHDYRVMREDRGYFCFPEIDLHVTFAAGLSALICSKLTPRAALDAMTTGRRYPGPDAHAHGLVDEVAPQDELEHQAAALVAGLAGKDRKTLGTIKATMFADVVAALRG